MVRVWVLPFNKLVFRPRVLAATRIKGWRLRVYWRRSRSWGEFRTDTLVHADAAPSRVGDSQVAWLRRPENQGLASALARGSGAGPPFQRPFTTAFALIHHRGCYVACARHRSEHRNFQHHERPPAASASRGCAESVTAAVEPDGSRHPA